MLSKFTLRVVLVVAWVPIILVTTAVLAVLSPNALGAFLKQIGEGLLVRWPEGI